MSKQPYKLGNPGTVGGAAAKAGADIGTAISEGVAAVTGLKKHRANLEHLANETQRGHERMLESMSHADSLAAKAKERGQDMRVKADHSSVEYESRSVKEPKSTKEKVVDAAIDVAKSAVTGGTGGTGGAIKDAAVGAMRSFVETKKARGITGGPKAPKSGVAGRKSRVAEPTSTVDSGSATASTPSASDKMRDFNATKKARGITGGSKVAATAVRTRSAKNAANPKIYPAGINSTPEQVRVNVAAAWRDKKKAMQASKGAK
jgi:hypothetical protein